MSTGLEIIGLKVNVGQFTLLVDDLCVGASEIVGVMGQSGSGKSTLLGAIAGFIPLESGKISVGGVDLVETPPERRGMAYVPQRSALFPNMTVLENVAFPLRVRKVARVERERRAMEWLERCRIAPLAGRYPDGLSGGEAQRASMARALIAGSKVLLMDEPFSSLDISLREALRTEIKDLILQAGVSALVVSHDPDDILALSPKACLIAGGRVGPVKLAAEVVDQMKAFSGV